MKLHELLAEAIIRLDDDEDEIVQKPFVSTGKFHKALDPNQKRRMMTDIGSSKVKSETEQDVQRAAEFVRNLLLNTFSGRLRTTFDPITYEKKWIRIKVAWDHNIKTSEQQRADMDALAVYLGSEDGVKISRDENHKYVLVQPHALIKWIDDEFPTTVAEISGDDAGRAYDPYLAKKNKAAAKAAATAPAQESPKPKVRRITPDDLKQERIDAARRKRDAQTAWEFERARKERERLARVAQADAERAAKTLASKQAGEENDKATRLSSVRKGWGR